VERERDEKGSSNSNINYYCLKLKVMASSTQRGKARGGVSFL
jgi:hypothetical protein